MEMTAKERMSAYVVPGVTVEGDTKISSASQQAQMKPASSGLDA